MLTPVRYIVPTLSPYPTPPTGRVVEMSSFAENFGLLGMYTRSLPWGDLRGATLPDSGERAYTLSKTYILMAARELARRLEGSGVDVITGAGAVVRWLLVVRWERSCTDLQSVTEGKAAAAAAMSCSGTSTPKAGAEGGFNTFLREAANA